MQTTSATAHSPGSQRLLQIVALILWGAALYGVLQIYRLSGVLPAGMTGHTICGPWGCGPPIEALVSYHGFWFVLLLPIGWLAGKAWLEGETRQPSEEAGGHGQKPFRAKWLRLGGWILTGVSLSGMAAIVVDDAARWLSTAHASTYLLQRMLFQVATYVELPLIPLACIGGIWLWQSRHARTRLPATPSAPAASPTAGVAGGALL